VSTTSGLLGTLDVVKMGTDEQSSKPHKLRAKPNNQPGEQTTKADITIKPLFQAI